MLRAPTCIWLKLLEIVLSEKYTFPVDQLLTYGDCRDIGTNFDDWPDYLKLGLTRKIKTVLKMIVYFFQW